ncbi:MAG: cation:proton antiporter, partial [Candidatus Cloacimonadota bacterium]|nr:cation:proton antiporter [Candidatus Cloacimonadota bacterium]
ENNILLNLAIIIFLSKILGAFSKKFNQPPVIGMLLLGIVLGPTLLNVIKPSEIIAWIGKIGVLFLLFEAGLETNIKRIRKESNQALPPALGGIIVPFTFGFLLSYFTGNTIAHSSVTGIIFSATSVSVSVMTLIDMGKMKSIEGRTIVNSAIIDDIFGIILLTFIFGLTDDSVIQQSNLLFPIVKIVLFFVFALVAGYFIFKPFFINLKKFMMDNVAVSLAIALVLLYSWFAELTGLAAITGAYFAGLIIGQTQYKNTIQDGISTVGKSFFIDVFFVNIGLEFNLLDIETAPLFLIIFVILAIISKILGCGVGARITNLDTLRSLRIGSGMVPRGEVSLIVANMALQKGIINTNLLSATIMTVIISAIVTPVLLKYSFTKFRKKSF